jgi:hypothetical protein
VNGNGETTAMRTRTAATIKKDQRGERSGAVRSCDDGGSQRGNEEKGDEPSPALSGPSQTVRKGWPHSLTDASIISKPQSLAATREGEKRVG